MVEDSVGHEPPLLIQRYRERGRDLDIADSFVFIDADGSSTIEFNEFLRFAGYDRHGNHMETPVLPFGRAPVARTAKASIAPPSDALADTEAGDGTKTNTGAHEVDAASAAQNVDRTAVHQPARVASSERV